MPPFVALILCTIFVLWLLTLDRKRSPENSLALWIPTIWVLLISSRPLALWFSYVAGEGEYGSPLDRNFLIIIMIMCFSILFKRRFAFSKIMKENIWLILLTVYMLISTLWSDIFFTSLTRWIREIIALMMAFLLLTENNPREAMLSILRRTTYILIPFSIILIKYYPIYGVAYSRWSGELMWVGVTSQKNGLGRLCIVAIFFLGCSIIERWHDRSSLIIKYQTIAEISLLLISFYLLRGPSIYAMSATAVISLSAGLTAFILLLSMNKLKYYPSANTMMAVLAAVIILGTLTVFTAGATIGELTGAIGRDTTMTGRTDVWKSLLPSAMNHIIWGHGFGAFWTSQRRDFFEISGGHNSYLDLILDIGFVGLVFVTLFLLSSCRRAQRIMKVDFYWGCLWFCFLLMSVVHGISESSIVGFSPQLMAMLIFFAITSSCITYATEQSHEEGHILENDRS